MPELPWLAPGDPFPPTASALDEPPGLLAAGGSLDTGTLIRAYRQGIFPWFNPGDPILWWTPDPRLVLYPDRFHASRRLRRRLRNADLRFSLDHAFDAVVRACAEPRPDQPGTWITEAMREAYGNLFRIGYAHSVEVWRDDRLVGGVYGVQLGGVFFGESMFSRTSDASKCALWLLCALRDSLGLRLLDCQVASGHLLRLGAEEIPRTDFEDHLSLWTTLPSRHPGHVPPAPLADYRHRFIVKETGNR